MNKKVTRRAVLGTTIAGLVVAPFMMQRFRSKRSKELLDAISFDSAYGKIDVPLDKIDSDLSISERAKVLEVFEKERARWLSFRGMEGDFRLSKTHQNSGQVVNTEGFLCLKFDLREPLDSSDGVYFPHDLQFNFSKSKDVTPYWTIRWSGRFRSGEPEISGTDEGALGMQSLTLFAPLLVRGIAAVSNDDFKNVLPLVKLTANPEDMREGSYTIGPNGTLTSDGVLAPTWKFIKGQFSGYIPRREPRLSYVECSMSDAELSDGFLFPKKFEIRPVLSGGKLPDDLNDLDETLMIEFINTRVFTV